MSELQERLEAFRNEAGINGNDFGIEDVCIHVTTAPSENLMEKCLDNLNSGLRPVIVTTSSSLAGALSLAEIKEEFFCLFVW